MGRLHLWAGGLAAVLFISGCSTAKTEPVKLEMPTTKRHFIVLVGPTWAVPVAESAGTARMGLVSTS
jgi:hypothetical protein